MIDARIHRRPDSPAHPQRARPKAVYSFQTANAKPAKIRRVDRGKVTWPSNQWNKKSRPSATRFALHDRRYYVDAAPTITDLEYDRLLAKLRELEAAHPELVTPDSPTQRVGGEPIEGFRTVAHARPMFSIDNTYDAADLRKWASRAFEATDPTLLAIVEEMNDARRSSGKAADERSPRAA